MEETERLLNHLKVKVLLRMYTIATFVKVALSHVTLLFTPTMHIAKGFLNKINLQVLYRSWWAVETQTNHKITISSENSSTENNASLVDSFQQYSPTFLAILHQIEKHDAISAKILASNGVDLTDCEYHQDKCSCDQCSDTQEQRSGRIERFKSAMMILRKRNPFRIAKNVQCIIR